MRKCGKRNGKGYIRYKQFDKCLQTKETIDRIYYNQHCGFPKILDFKLTVLYPSKSDYNLAIELSTC
ncbi:MAG: hypothetical protein OCU22_08555 [Canidatus Methanoxibalbensis ujae]|nr:hypothetical protein [Candidatus Methanoxibalbensis ujae]